MILLAIASIPFVGDAVKNIHYLPHGALQNWDHFVGDHFALSGIEAIANATGVMKLDPGSTLQNPSVAKTSRKAIILVMLEVCFFTAFFGFMMNALPDLRIVDQEVLSPDGTEVAIRCSAIWEIILSPIFGEGQQPLIYLEALSALCLLFSFYQRSIQRWLL